jgi:hypothetical protein
MAGPESVPDKSAQTSAGNLDAQEIADATSLAIPWDNSQVSGSPSGIRLKFCWLVAVAKAVRPLQVARVASSVIRQ